MTTIYKTLLEVKLLHEYYLTSAAGETIFSIPSQEGRLNFLNEGYHVEKTSINEILEFAFPEKNKATYNNYNLKLHSTYSGFKIGIRVVPKKLADGSLVYKPLADVPADLCINVQLLKNNNTIDLITNKRMAAPLPAAYLFCNNTTQGEPQYPFLTAPVPALRASYNYEQGELAAIGAGNINGFYNDASGGQWKPFEGTDFANENDRLLLPLQFYYSFPGDTNITTANFILSNTTGEIISSLQVIGTNRMNNCLVDFTNVKDIITAPVAGNIKDFVFQLQVDTNDGYRNTHAVFCNEDIYNSNVWGMVALQPKTFNSDFDLFTSEGYLKKMQDAAGVWTNEPVFEIPVKSRFMYRRYSNNKGKTVLLDPTSEIAKYLEVSGNKLFTKQPASLTQSYFLLQEDSGPGTKYFPNPLPGSIQKDSKNRLYYDVMVPVSDNFPVSP